MSAAEPSFLFAMAAGGGLLLLGLLWQLLALRKSNERLEKTARERELVIDTLRGTESRFYELTETSPVGIFFSDLDGRRIFANHKLQQLSGHANDNPGLDSWLEALHPEDRDRVRHAWHQTLREDAPYLLEYRYVLPTGEVRWVLGQATPQKSESGEIIGYVGTVTDITEQKLSEQNLEAHEARLVEAQRISNIGFWERDIASGTLIWSDEMYRIFGLTKGEGDLSPDEIFKCFHPEDQALIREKYGFCLAAGQPYDMEHRIIRADGEVRWVHVKAEFSCDASGKPRHLFGTTQDITESHQMLEALRQSEDRFQMSFEVGGAGMFVADSSGNFVRVNKSFVA